MSKDKVIVETEQITVADEESVPEDVEQLLNTLSELKKKVDLFERISGAIAAGEEARRMDINGRLSDITVATTSDVQSEDIQLDYDEVTNILELVGRIISQQNSMMLSKNIYSDGGVSLDTISEARNNNYEKVMLQAGEIHLMILSLIDR